MVLHSKMALNALIKPLLCIVCAVSLISCDKKNTDFIEPDVSEKRPFVDYEVVRGDDPFTFKFENKSTDYEKLEWRFGDDSLSTEVSPTHMYFKDGVYEVNLKATAADGSTARKLVKVEIKPESVATLSAVETSVVNTVKFSAVSTANIASIKWDFGDKTTSEEISPTKAYAAGKLYTASMIVTTDKGSKATVKKLVSSNGSIVDITGEHLLNVGPPFVAAERFGGRWGVVADWRVNAAVRQREGGMGGWDEWEGNTMSMESWGGEPDIINGKIQQTLLKPLTPGKYFYQISFHDYSAKDQLYNVVAKGNELPDVDNVTTDANVLGFTKLTGSFSGTKEDPVVHTTAFQVTQEGPVTVGFVATFIQPDQNFKLYQVRLYKKD